MKINKYIKLILCALTIVALTIPTYAAITSADSSSFVTKAEFDTAFSDISSKLSSVETALNSKIDSKVSAYLNQKGIWSGKEQNCNYDTRNLGIYENVLYIWSDSKNIAKGSLAKIVDARSNNGSKRIEGELPSDFAGGVKVIDKIDKSGLLAFTYEIVCPSNEGETSNRYNTAHFKEEDDGKDARSWNLGAILTNKEYQGMPVADKGVNDSNIYEIPKADIIGTETWDTYFSTNNKMNEPNDVYLNFPTGVHTIYAFVNKGDSIWFNINLGFGQGSKASLYADNDFGQSAWFLTNMKAVVY